MRLCLIRPTRALGALLAVVGLLGALQARAADVDLSQPTPQVANRKPEPRPEGEPLRHVQLSRWRSAIVAGTVVGKVEKGLFCSDSKPRRFDKGMDDFMKARVGRSFDELASELRFTRKRGEDSVFESDATAGVDFRAGATLMALDYRICDRDGTRGTAYARVKWELFSLRQQRVVYTAEIEASFRSDESLPAGEFSKRFGTAIAGNLLADPACAEALRGGGAAPATALAPLVVHIGPTVAGPVSVVSQGLLQAVVTIESGTATGTAFYIGRDGLMLTNQHVVADAKFVKVKLANGRSLIGEVVRVDKPRDVALLRTDPPGFAVLGLRQDEARIGEEAFAIGSPFGAVLSGSLTRGIVSARRVVEGVPYLQSDAAVNPGNSGGPLIDATGQVLAITQMRPGAGIGLFIPIADALDKLGLKTQP